MRRTIALFLCVLAGSAFSKSGPIAGVQKFLSSSSSSSSESNERHLNLTRHAGYQIQTRAAHLKSALRASADPDRFDCQPKAYLKNVNSQKVIEDWVSPNWQDDSQVYGRDKRRDYTWNQVLTVKRRGEDEFYSLAFDRRQEVKVLTAEARDDTVFSKLYDPSASSKAQWEFIKLVEESYDYPVYQLISIDRDRALAMNVDTNEVYLAEPNTQEKEQHWEFVNVETEDTLSFLQPSFCLDGPSQEYPSFDTTCYAPDATQKRADPDSCSSYLLCPPDTCIWRREDCPEGEYYNQKLQYCVPREEADCAAGLFRRRARAFVSNAENNKVIYDCQSCFYDREFPEDSNVFDSSRRTDSEYNYGSKWFQTIVMAKRDNSDYYSFAFDRIQSGRPKVLTEKTKEPGEILSRVFGGSQSPEYNTEWRIVPTGDAEKYQIVSVKTERALTMTNEVIVEQDGFDFFQLKMQEPDQNDNFQLWTFTSKNITSSTSRSIPASPGCQLKVYLRNINFDRVIEDQAPNEGRDWKEDSNVFGADKNSEHIWNQVLIVKRRGNDNFYSLAFDKKARIKVLTEAGDYPISKLYKTLESSQAQWKFVQVEDNLYQIVSISNNRALAMADDPSGDEDINQVYLVNPDSEDRKQHWEFKNYETDEIVSFGEPKRCRFGPREEYPARDTPCYAPDEGLRRADPKYCNQYLECNPENCIWSGNPCPQGLSFDHVRNKCIEFADCAATLFGRKAWVYIENVMNNKVLTDCQSCGYNRPFPLSSEVVGYTRDNYNEWTQVLLAEKLAGSSYYSFAFDRIENGQFKVLFKTSSKHAPQTVSSRAFNVRQVSTENEWEIIPTTESEKYLIVSSQSQALTMTNHGRENGSLGLFHRLEMQELDENNIAQLWTFRRAVDLYPSRRKWEWENSSKIEISGHSGRGQCQRNSGALPDGLTNPTPNSVCYQEDVSRKTSSPNSCKAYLECMSSNCKWREYQCSDSRYWNNAQKRCVHDQQQGTCGVSIFGAEAKVHIHNVYFGKLLNYHEGGQQGNQTPDQSTPTLIGCEEHDKQVISIVAKRRGTDDFYSLAFDIQGQGQEKVITDNGSFQPVLEMYNPSDSLQSQWKFAPVSGQRNVYQIISTTSNQAMAVEKIGERNAHQVRLVQPNQWDKKQQWLIKDAETGELLPVDKQQPIRNNMQRVGNAISN